MAPGTVAHWPDSTGIQDGERRLRTHAPDKHRLAPRPGHGAHAHRPHAGFRACRILLAFPDEPGRHQLGDLPDAVDHALLRPGLRLPRRVERVPAGAGRALHALRAAPALHPGPMAGARGVHPGAPRLELFLEALGDPGHRAGHLGHRAQHGPPVGDALPALAVDPRPRPRARPRAQPAGPHQGPGLGWIGTSLAGRLERPLDRPPPARIDRALRGFGAGTPHRLSTDSLAGRHGAGLLPGPGLRSSGGGPQKDPVPARSGLPRRLPAAQGREPVRGRPVPGASRPQDSGPPSPS